MTIHESEAGGRSRSRWLMMSRCGFVASVARFRHQEIKAQVQASSHSWSVIRIRDPNLCHSTNIRNWSRVCCAATAGWVMSAWISKVITPWLSNNRPSLAHLLTRRAGFGVFVLCLCGWSKRFLYLTYLQFYSCDNVTQNRSALSSYNMSKIVSKKVSSDVQIYLFCIFKSQILKDFNLTNHF